MPNFKEIENNIIAALLTIAKKKKKNRDVSQDEISVVYKNFGGNNEIH